MSSKLGIETKSWIIYFLFKINKLNVNLLDIINYSDLIFLSEKIKNYQEYQNLILKIVELQEKNLKAKARKRRIKIGFIVDSSSLWGCDDIYNKLENIANCEPYVIIPLRSQDKKMRIVKRKTIYYFKKKKIKYYIVKEIKDARWGKKLPDILFSQVPYEGLFLQENFCLENIPCSCMQMFIPYTFWIARMIDESFINNKNMRIFSKIFAPSKEHMIFFEKSVKGGIDKRRLFYSGYPKCDSYYNKNNIDINEIWKNGKDKKRIVYAPGLMDSLASFSTFNLNYIQILNIAKRTKNTVSWIIRLHPFMAEYCIKQGIFSNIKEWNFYIKEWEKLDNAKISIHGDYQDIFKTSDGMIMDSISFLPVYQYVHKPLLLLTRNTQKMNKLGGMLKEVVYTADAKDMDGINNFINNVIIKGNDEKLSIRKVFFKKNLDYVYKNKKLASDYIVNEIEKVFC